MALFDYYFLMAFHDDHTSVNIDDYGFNFALSLHSYQDLEIDFSERSGCLVKGVGVRNIYLMTAGK
jgi:hypothetical protein